MFELDSRLENDTFFAQDFELSKLLLMNNKDFLWLILVPMKENMVELTDLSLKDQKILLNEINLVSKSIQDNFKADKMNIATLGNQVSQLHIHIIARYKNDKAFPNPVWGVESEKYSEDEAKKLIEKIREICQ